MSEASSALKQRITDDMKSAMRAGEKERLGTIRLILAAIKQVEVDGQKALSDDDLLPLLDKMAKQRRESITQFRAAGREDLASKEESELEIIQTYLPAALTEAEIEALIGEAIAQSGAQGMQDMGKVMGILKPKARGRADMGALSAKIKARLAP